MFGTDQAIQDYLAEVQRTDPVPCNGCTACCRHDTSVALKPEFGDDPNLYPPETLAWEFLSRDEPPVLALRRQSNGDCIFLRRGRCKIYDKRPQVCRAFDCRRAFAQIPEDKHEAVVAAKVFDQEILDAARARKHTMRLLPIEERVIKACHEQGMAESLIGKQR